LEWKNYKQYAATGRIRGFEEVFLYDLIALDFIAFAPFILKRMVKADLTEQE
jgi:hypothetical protein